LHKTNRVLEQALYTEKDYGYFSEEMPAYSSIVFSETGGMIPPNGGAVGLSNGTGQP
jgi:hypothetical protein